MNDWMRLHALAQAKEPRKWRLMYADVVISNERVISVNYPNGAHMGAMFADVDGYFKWWPFASGGCIEAWVLRELADKLDEVNKEWDETVTRDIGKSGR